MLSEDLLRFGDLHHALNLLIQRLLRGAGYIPLSESQRALAVAKARLEDEREASTLSHSVAEVSRASRQELEEIISLERRALVSQLHDERERDVLGPEAFARRLSQQLAFRVQPDEEARRLRARLATIDSLPLRLTDRLDALRLYDFIDQQAAARFNDLYFALRDSWRAAISEELTRLLALPSWERRKLEQMFAAITKLAEEISQGRAIDFAKFMRRYGRFFPRPRPRSFVELVARFRERAASLPFGMHVELQRIASPNDPMSSLAAMFNAMLSLCSAIDQVRIDSAELHRALEVVGWPDDIGIIKRLVDAGYLRRGGPGWELTPRATRRIGECALKEVFSDLNRGEKGAHGVDGCGDVGDRTIGARPFQFGDAFDLALPETMQNALRHGGGKIPVDLEPTDFEIYTRGQSVRSATVLLVDLSWSMALRGSFAASKKAALALISLVESRFPGDMVYVVGFSAFARQLDRNELLFLRWDENVLGTNLQHGLAVARRLLRHKGFEERQIVILSDGEPTAHTEENGRSYFAYPPSPITIRKTLTEVARCTREAIKINFIMLERNYYLKEFVNQVVRLNGGRAFYTTPDRLGDYVVLDYVKKNRKRIRAGR